MERSIGLWVFISVFSLSAQFAGPVEVSSRVLERSGHHTSWETVWQTVDPDVGSGLVTNRFVQLATGLNRPEDESGDWIPAVAVWEPTAEGFIVARQTAHQVILAPNLNTEGAADILTRDGVRLRATPLGLMYLTSETDGILLATIKDCLAEQVSDTEVLYRNALDNLHTDVRFRLGLDRLELDLILREALPAPEVFGLDSRSVRLVVVSEFFDSTAPIVLRETDVADSAGAALVDQWLGFGDMQMVPGRAFAADADPLASGLPVGKMWQEDSRSLLFEAVEYSRLEPLLDALPAYDEARLKSITPTALAGVGRVLPKPSLRPATVPSTLSLVSLDTRRFSRSPLPEAPGVVLDWVLLTTQTSVTLAGNLTYYVSGSVNVQNLTIEGGSVTKYDPAGSLYVSGSVVCRTGPYRPAFFTSVYDSTVGEFVASGDPTSGYYGNPMLRIYPDGVSLEHLRFRHAQTGLVFDLQGGPYTHYLRHAHFVRCQTAVSAYGPSSSTPQVFYAGNLLFANVGTCFSGYLYQGTVEHLTGDGINLVANGSTYYGNSTLNVKNSILANVVSLVGSGVSLSGSYNGFWTSPQFGSPAFPVSSNPFLTVGSGAHYLGALSPFWNKGTTSIDGTLAAALKQRTVDPPMERTVSFTQDTILAGYAQRDTDTPDLGYHYEPLDSCWTGLTLNNATLTLTNGVAIGIYGASGLQLQAGAKLVSQGSPQALNRFVRPVLVQKQYTGTWLATPSSMSFLKVAGAYTPRPEVRMRFTELVVPSMNSEQQRWLDCNQTPSTLPTYPLGVIALTDCQLWETWLSLYPGWSGMTVALTNNLLQGNSLYCDQKRYYGTATFSLTLFNNLFSGGVFSCHYNDPSVAWTIRDNFFDRVTVSAGGSYNTANSNNGYHLATALPGGSANRTVTVTPNYQTGSLGQFYYPATGSAGTITYELTDRGSRTASTARLFHHTTRTAQSSKDTSTVDIGFHYAATGSGGAPTDVDNDGLADWIEDVNGDGSTTGETFRFNNADSNGNGLGDLQEYELQWNVLVNDPAQDYGNEQNSQFESTCVVLNRRVTVAYVDSNQLPGPEPRAGGVYALGQSSYLSSRTPRFVGYAVSRNGGLTFDDMTVPPLARAGAPTDDDGDAGDPVLAVDRASGAIYLAGTSPRNPGGFRGIPVWKSTDAGTTFGQPVIVRNDIINTDKPWIAVDDWPGTGQHDVYVAFKNYGTTPEGLWLSVSVNGTLDNWTTPSQPFRIVNDPTLEAVNSPIIVVGANHVGYLVWFERDSNGVNWLRTRTVSSRGAVLGATNNVVQLATANPTAGNLELLRGSTAASDDWFRVFPFPVVAVNPDPMKADDVYVAYADKGVAPGDRADVFFVRSLNGGTSWSAPARISTVANNDQWMPMMCVKPDGTKLLAAWYDRRNDANNSLIDVYGRWGTIATDGNVSFGTEFRITTANFPPVFAGTLETNEQIGHYDPVYPPAGKNLHWHYDDWPASDLVRTDESYRGHVGEYNAAFAEGHYAYLTWTDYRLQATGTEFNRNQSDIRLVRITWPQ